MSPTIALASYHNLSAKELRAIDEWPDLDADIELEALQHPEHYPLQWSQAQFAPTRSYP